MSRVPLLCAVSVLFVVGCSSTDSGSANSDPTPMPPSKSVTPPAVAPVNETVAANGAADAEKALRSMGVPIYPDAKVNSSEHFSTDAQETNAVFVTSATVKQVEYFYNGYPELKSQTANGSTVFTGSINKVPMVIEVRAKEGKTEIVAQARRGS